MRSCAYASNEPHVTPASFFSCSTPLFQVFFGLPLFLCPWGFHWRALLAMLSLNFLNVCPIHVHPLLLSRISSDSRSVAFHRSRFLILSYHLVLFWYWQKFRPRGHPVCMTQCPPPYVKSGPKPWNGEQVMRRRDEYAGVFQLGQYGQPSSVRGGEVKIPFHRSMTRGRLRLVAAVHAALLLANPGRSTWICRRRPIAASMRCAGSWIQIRSCFRIGGQLITICRKKMKYKTCDNWQSEVYGVENCQICHCTSCLLPRAYLTVEANKRVSSCKILGRSPRGVSRQRRWRKGKGSLKR